MIHISGKTYELVHEHRTAWNPEMFRDRYSEVLERYDYILGDWGYNQLRLKGFFKEGHPKSTKESSVSSMMDYINEYCNFGCAYFIIEKTAHKEGTSIPPQEWESEAELEGAATAEDTGAPAQQRQGIALQSRQSAQGSGASAPADEREEGRTERQARPERAERHGQGQARQGRPDRQGRPGQQRPDRPQRPERTDRQARGERPDKAERPEQPDRQKPFRQRNRTKPNKFNPGAQSDAGQQPNANSSKQGNDQLTRPADATRPVEEVRT
ncbi:DUF1027 domain-containing protein [Paenibacillus sp. ACRRX]|uniref:YutD-like domain-containing protein n=1 Tax=unclassified Paenibacillus TaxID=185978 RepID=UPI001EF4A5A2|nr:YutD-like domain-containing protein [Paenibacillus sp. UMB4589-SE434]MCG7410417.1 DUF1027 domain-containing protein [Paenibacillus sp. ACRRX]MDK8183839.1 DUF1027 domain-containing protein [Paenibacillus sp. UMB4589-SE434]